MPHSGIGQWSRDWWQYTEPRMRKGRGRREEGGGGGREEGGGRDVHVNLKVVH